MFYKISPTIPAEHFGHNVTGRDRYNVADGAVTGVFPGTGTVEFTTDEGEVYSVDPANVNMKSEDQSDEFCFIAQVAGGMIAYTAGPDAVIKFWESSSCGDCPACKACPACNFWE